MKDLRPVIQMTLDGEFVAEFISIRAAAKKFGGTAKAISDISYRITVLHRENDSSKGKVKGDKATNIAYGYRWKYKEI